jgi:hypothetical protein
MKIKYILFIPVFFALITSCESDAERKKRLTLEAEAKIEEKQRKFEEERRNKLIEKFRDNNLSTGETPYSYCLGSNDNCNYHGCSQLRVTTPENSDVLVTLKKEEQVVRHAYIQGGQSYTFQVPDGIYQPFFYYGNGWNPDKVMKATDCGEIKGGFVLNEHFGKDTPQRLENSILQYELILQANGNFSTQPSNSQEAF